MQDTPHGLPPLFSPRESRGLGRVGIFVLLPTLIVFSGILADCSRSPDICWFVHFLVPDARVQQGKKCILSKAPKEDYLQSSVLQALRATLVSVTSDILCKKM